MCINLILTMVENNIIYRYTFNSIYIYIYIVILNVDVILKYEICKRNKYLIFN